ncbi:MAG: hypothetical protein D6759_05785, partial [Chloroflexi bacterium]
GPAWAELVDRIAGLSEDHEEVLAFSLMMIRLAGCLTCNLDSYRASLGCATCSRRTILGFKGDDQALLEQFEKARQEVSAYLATSGRADAPPLHRT